MEYQTLQQEQSAGAMGGVLITLLTVIITIALAVIVIVSLWKIFEKAGTKGFYSIIPVYNIYNTFKLFMGNVLFMFLIFVPCIGWIFNYICMYKMCKCFGKGIGFFLLMLFVPIVAYPMLAFGNDQYQMPE